jgi:hypothetical protein
MPKIDLLGVKLELPEGWRGVSAAFVAPPNNASGNLLTLTPTASFRENISLTLELVPAGTTPERYHQAQLEQLRLSGTKTTPVSSEKLIHKGAPALIAETTTAGPTGERVRQVFFITIRATEAWIAVASLLEDARLEESRTRVRQILTSLDF